MSDVLAFSVAVAYDSGSPVRRLHRLASSRQEVLDLARSLNGDIDLATVVYEVVGPGYKKWIREKVPAMDDPRLRADETASHHPDAFPQPNPVTIRRG
ncbi:hypothetical protein [Burkholderia cepacia]|uniref:hypothetical protein n=1 Tax=Burkholderia cepacia TaxID=292 RepID=UPI0011BF7991|nr:hypothetical protein [Burkholderia cepacia]